MDSTQPIRVGDVFLIIAFSSWTFYSLIFCVESRLTHALSAATTTHTNIAKTVNLAASLRFDRIELHVELPSTIPTHKNALWLTN